MENNSPMLAMGTQYDYDNLIHKTYADLLDIQNRMGIVDNGFQGREDMVDRIMLTDRKARRDSHKPFVKFLEMRSNTDVKCNLLKDIMQQLHGSLDKISTGPLSTVLMEECLLKHDDILVEIEARIRALEEREACTIIAGETNGGKSTLLNVALGEEILPTDVLHCTLTITKIKYSDTYSIETLDQSGRRETYPCKGTKDTHDLLKVLVAREDQRDRLRGSNYKEITLWMPAPILKSGMTLVDTPGIGEMEEMDNVTMNYIKSTRADGFIYIIKSDTAGGIQEDRLVSFLRAVQDDYQKQSVESAIDPRAALFICNRWDTINEEEVEIVKMNALTKLDLVWPGFKTEQAQFFSSKRAKLHLDADPEFITDNLNDLLLCFNKLFKRVAHNNIQNQYKWIKAILPAASRHLSSMINLCISSNEDLEELFRTAAQKQEILRTKSNEKCPDLEDSLVIHKEKVKSKLQQIFSTIEPDQLDGFRRFTSSITANYFQDPKNKAAVDLWIMNSLISHWDKQMQESGILDSIENETKSKIEEHIGLFQDQIKEITEIVKGKTEIRREKRKLSSNLGSFDDSQESYGGSYTLDMPEHTSMNPSQLKNAIESLLRRRKSSSLPKAIKTVLSKVHLGNQKFSVTSDIDIPAYVAKRVVKLADLMKNDQDTTDGFVVGYLYLIELYIKSAVDHIPHFIKVNNTLMDNIRDHRRTLQENKGRMKTVLDEFEPYREQLRGYGLLYMEDHNADNVFFNTNKQISIVNIETSGLGFSTKIEDSGFSDCGSSRNKSKGFWTHSMNAVIKIDGEPVDIILKAYSTPIDTPTQLLEIASLRYLGHKSLAPFIGMTRIACNSDETDSSEKVSTFIFKGSLVSARIFKSNPLIVFKNFLKKFVHELICGLEYMHRENMVHLELNLDTVMVNFLTGDVQLCQQCKPRAIVLPKYLSFATQAAVCLSPMVLHGAEYGIADDIYAFMLLLWELLFPNNLPYAKERQWPLQTFIDKVSPYHMLGPQLDNMEASETVILVFKRGLMTDRRSHCLTTGDIRRYFWRDEFYRAKIMLDEMADNPLLNPKSIGRRPPVKRNSKDITKDLEEAKAATLENRTNDVNAARSMENSCTERIENGPRPIPPPRRKHENNKRNATRRPTLLEISENASPYTSGRKYSTPIMNVNPSTEFETPNENGEERTLTCSANHTLPLEGDRTVTCSANHTLPLEGDRTVTCSANHTLSLEGNRTVTWRANHTLSLEGDRTDNINQEMRARRGIRKSSVPVIPVSDQKKLMEIYKNISKAPSSNARESIPRENPDRTLSLQNSAQSSEKKIHKKRFNRFRNQSHVQEDDLYQLKRSTLYNSVPGNLSSLPGAQSGESKKGFFSVIWSKIDLRKKSKEFRPLSQAGNPISGGKQRCNDEDIPNSVRNAVESPINGSSKCLGTSKINDQRDLDVSNAFFSQDVFEINSDLSINNSTFDDCSFTNDSLPSFGFGDSVSTLETSTNSFLTDFSASSAIPQLGRSRRST